jgi:RNA polymerase-binding transcription factor DksA
MADRTEDYGERSAITETLDQRLDDINNALQKIVSGNYGICEVCGNPIEEDRLEANPAARTCKACMEKVV